MTRDRDAMGCELDAALEDAQVLAEEYAGYDEYAARRRIARRVAADRARAQPRRGAAAAPGQAVPAPGPPGPAESDHLVLDAACHVRAARALDSLAGHLVDSRAFAELALAPNSWPHSPRSALLFGCLLHLAGRPEGAQFWFQYAAGADSQAAAHCLYLYHLARAEVATARHWKLQADALAPDPGLPALLPLPDNLEGALAASVIWTSPPITTQDLTALSAPGCLGADRYRLGARLRRAVTGLVPEEDPDLGEVFAPGPQVAVAVARHARLDTSYLTDEANGWALAPPRPAPLPPAPRRSPQERPTAAALESAHQALRVLELVNRFSGGVSLTQIARCTGLPQLALARVMERLVRAKLATPAGPGAYVAGTALALTGAVDGPGRLSQTLAWVRDAVGAAVYVARYTDGEVSITEYADSPTAPPVEEWVDFRAAAHASAVGKALLTQLADDGRKDHLARHRLARLTPHTVTSERELFHQLDDRLPDEPLLDLQEYALGTVCAAVPITAGPNAECLALSMPAGPDPGLLLRAARILQSEAAAVLLALLVSGGADRPERCGTGV
ncbi:IclR family transcriptional regulator C-terminal domain-containing protein [Streptomyces sp. NPDC032472]|uniref:IclR family transcriptional regulator domain-containing protein n=1 Tax=Streptomyces sp. NPDC032472 TaxID=3155018 RepID=UPI0033FE55C3